MKDLQDLKDLTIHDVQPKSDKCVRIGLQRASTPTCALPTQGHELSLLPTQGYESHSCCPTTGGELFSSHDSGTCITLLRTNPLPPETQTLLG